MKATINFQNKNYEIDFSKPLDISIPLTNSDQNPIAWYLDKPEINPVISGDFIGKVSTGKSSTNFNNILFNPHAHGTHTECLGHITTDFFSVNKSLKTYFFGAILISIKPENLDGDLVITKHQIEKALEIYNNQNIKPTALIIRTLPNKTDKLHKKYSHTNPAFLDCDAAKFIRESEIKHLLIDLPSVDKENDGGKLLAHKAFWNVKNIENLNDDARLDCTITEMIFVENNVLDGFYFLNLQMAPFENDASPSKPILYKCSKI